VAIVEGAARRIRPKVMTVACMLAGLAPIMWSAGAGSDVMKRIAAPMIGGILTSFLLELAVYPAIYSAWKCGPNTLAKHMGQVDNLRPIGNLIANRPLRSVRRAEV